MVKIWIGAAGIGGCLAVAAGAVGQHLVAGDAHATLLVEQGARYLMYHSLALLGLAALDRGILGRRRWRLAAGGLFMTGMVLFSGLLLLRAFSGITLLPFLVPAGGIAFMAGWLALAGSIF